MTALELDTMYCGAIKRGDIFLCSFGLLAGEEKPVVVLQDSILNERLSTVLVVPVEQIKKGERVFKNEVLLEHADTGFGSVGVCMLHRLQMVRRERMIAKKGELTIAKLQELYHALDVNLGRFRDR